MSYGSGEAESCETAFTLDPTPASPLSPFLPSSSSHLHKTNEAIPLVLKKDPEKEKLNHFAILPHINNLRE
jgi:hypothetical protein